MTRFLLPLLLLIAAPAAAAADAREERAVLAAVQEFFAALGARDEARIMATVVPEGRITAQRLEGRTGQLNTRGWAEWAKTISAADQMLEERMHSPEVRVRGPIASVWTEYSFWRGGKFSHCGIDNFDMAKVDGRWKIVNVSYTVQTKGCPRR
jgi:hypothetical protein